MGVDVDLSIVGLASDGFRHGLGGQLSRLEDIALADVATLGRALCGDRRCLRCPPYRLSDRDGGLIRFVRCDPAGGLADHDGHALPTPPRWPVERDLLGAGWARRPYPVQHRPATQGLDPHPAA